jgi:hypothetical protein
MVLLFTLAPQPLIFIVLFTALKMLETDILNKLLWAISVKYGQLDQEKEVKCLCLYQSISVTVP